MRRRIHTLADLVESRLWLLAWCLACARSSGRMDPVPILKRFIDQDWPLDLVAARRHFRCRCGRSDMLLLVPASAPRPVAKAELQFTPDQLNQKNMGEAIWFFLRKASKPPPEARVPLRSPTKLERPRTALQAALAEQLAQRRRDAWRVVSRPLPHSERLTAALEALEDRPMCNRYQVRSAHAEAVQLKMGLTPDHSLNYAGEVYPGYTGLVIAEGKARAMTWGFPLALKGKQGQPLKPRPVNNAREDKLRGWMWRDSFEHRRCLIPATAWAEAEGEKGRMTCTWHSLPGDEPFMLGGIWKPTDEWGDAYSMVMVDGCPQMADVHDRMPVILAPNEWLRWTDGTPAEAFALCQTWPHELMIERTDALWAAGK